MRRLGHRSSIATAKYASRALPYQVLAGPQVEVLRDLLRDRARSAEASAAPVSLERLADLVEIEAEVGRELLVLGRHRRDGQVGRNVVPPHPLVVNRSFVRDPLPEHEGGGRRRDPAPREDQQDRQGKPRDENPKDPTHPPGALRFTRFGVSLRAAFHCPSLAWLLE